MTIAIAKALEEGAEAVVCASTGNTAASAAAYAARAGLPAVVLQPAGAVASGKLAQARALGARLLEVEGSFDDALDSARELAEQGTHVLVNSLNPYRLEGQKTAAFEIAEELGAPPDVLALPYGGGGNTCAYAKGFAEWGAGEPRLLAVQSGDRARTVASAIRIRKPVHATDVAEAIERSRGKRGHGLRRADPQRLACARARGRCLLRAGFCGRPRRCRGIRARAGHTGRLRDHGPRSEGSGDRRPRVSGRHAPSTPTAARSRRRPHDDHPRARACIDRERGPRLRCGRDRPRPLERARDLGGERRRTRLRPPRRARVHARDARGRLGVRLHHPDPASARARLERRRDRTRPRGRDARGRTRARPRGAAGGRD